MKDYDDAYIILLLISNMKLFKMGGKGYFGRSIIINAECMFGKETACFVKQEFFTDTPIYYYYYYYIVREYLISYY